MTIMNSVSDTLADMDSIGERIRLARKRLDRTQEEFARGLGVSRGAVANWERGQGIKRENLVAISSHYALPLEWLISGQGTEPSAREPTNIEATPRRRVFQDEGLPIATIPAYGQAMGGEDGYFILNGNKAADILAPPGLVGVREAYAVYVSGDSMEPRYYAGEVLFVNPRLPVRRGDFVVVQVHYEGEDMPRGYVKRFVRMNDSGLVLAQFNPVKELRFDSAKVVSVHRITLSGDG
jgi:phage repressor protein C with HTH and peptisase S24 domain